MTTKDYSEFLKIIAGYADKPALFAPSEPADLHFWDDPHISKGMLETHLNPDTDLASRKPDTIDQQINHLVSSGLINSSDKLLDLGCGPGLLANRFAAKGVKVTGIDISQGSLNYAIAQARAYGFDIVYRLVNFLDLDYTNEFNAALQSFCEIGTLSDENRDILFRKIHRSLKPGGVFVFDVTTPFLKLGPCPQYHWHILDRGFWRPGRHLTMEMRFDYLENNIILFQTIVLDEDKMTVYRIWNHNYTPETLKPALEKAGFQIENIWNNLDGTPYKAGGEGLAVAARKR